MAGPFSWKKPSREEQPGPPFSHIMISSLAAGFVVGTNQKNNSLSLVSSIGSRPAYDSPMSKLTSGSAEPLTAKGLVALVRKEEVACLERKPDAALEKLFRLRRSYLACFLEGLASISKRTEDKIRRALESSIDTLRR